MVFKELYKMKKLILVAICFVSIQLSAQGNLQFNQVLTFEGTILNGTTLTPEFTPPTGKVWKIEYSNLKKIQIVVIKILK